MADRKSKQAPQAPPPAPAPAPEPQAPAAPAAAPANRTDKSVQQVRRLAPVDPATEKTPIRVVQPFETPSETVKIQKMSADVPADAVMQLDNEAFGKALGLSFLDENQETRVDVSVAPVEIVEEESAEETEHREAQEASIEGVKTGETAPQAPQEAPEEAPEDQEGAPEPEAPVAPLGRTPETPFVVSDAEGELEIPDLRFAFKANGKDYTDIPLDKVVRFAQMGIYNAEKEAKFADMSGKVGSLERRTTQAESRVKELESYYEKLLSDPTYYEKASTLYLEQNTPEQRIARAEEQVRALQAQFDLEREELRRAAHAEVQASELQHRHARDAEEQQAATFVRTDLAPKLERLIRENPLVNEREVLGQYTLLTAPLLDRGRVPLNRLAEVRTLVESDLTHWVSSVQAQRELDKQQADRRVTTAQAQATVAKRQIARTTAPQGKAAPPGPGPRKRYSTVDDWLKDGLGGNVAPQPDGQ